MNLPSFKGLTIKVTIISCLVFSFLLSLIFFAQYSFFDNELKKNFWNEAKNFFSVFSSSNAIAVMESPTDLDGQKTNLFSHFGNQSHVFAEALIFRNHDRSLVFPGVLEYMIFEKTLQLKEIEKLFDLHENTVQSAYIAGVNLFFYRVNLGEYTIFYYNYTVSFYDYYYMFVANAWFILILILLSFFSLSLYFSQLIVRPIREQNMALAMYNHNLAHEIKTPLSVIKTNFNMFEITKNQNFIISSYEELDCIENITNSLLFLTDAKSNRENFIETNIVDLLDNALLRFPFLNFEKKYPASPIFAFIDIRLFMILMKNIIENASKYASNKDAKITARHDCLIFENAISETLTPRELKNIEEVFYQSDNSRGSDGFGLGIPMMRKICEAFDWKMKISSYDKKFEVKIFL